MFKKLGYYTSGIHKGVDIPRHKLHFHLNQKYEIEKI